jgi:hypothetical protein
LHLHYNAHQWFVKFCVFAGSLFACSPLLGFIFCGFGDIPNLKKLKTSSFN